MTPTRLILQLSASVLALLLASCATNQKTADGKVITPDGKFVNPYPPGTYDHFKADEKYPKTYSVWKNDEVFKRTDASNSRLIINLATQRGILMNGDDVAMDYPICSGHRSHSTPKGEFKILEKIVDKRSNKYGRIYDATGGVVNSDADITSDAVPEGGRFEGAAMRYWMRLTWDGVGHHIGPVRRYPASHACIRGPSATMPLVYSKMAVGSTISVQ